MADQPVPEAPSTVDDSALATPAKENLEAVHEYEEASAGEVTPAQAAIERWSSFFGSPRYLLFLVVFVAAWITYSLLARHLGWRVCDAPPFPWLQGLVSLNSLVLTVAVLIRQNRMSQLEKNRAHLDLQINLLTEQKVSLLIKRFNEVHPTEPRHADGRRDELARPTDPVAMLQAIKHKSDRSGRT